MQNPKNTNPHLLEQDHLKLVDNTFTSPTLVGEPKDVPVIRDYIPTGTGEGTFRQVLLDGEGPLKKAVDRMGLVASISGINIPDEATKEVEAKAARMRIQLPKLLKDPEIAFLGSVVLSTDWFAGDSMERTIWFKHFLAIMKSESEFVHATSELRKDSPVSLAQVKPTTFSRDISLLNGDNSYKTLLNSTYFLRLIRLYRLPYNLFLNGSGFQSVPGSLIAVPAMHFMFLKDLLMDKFVWYQGRWTPIKQADRDSAVWVAIRDKAYMKSYYLGRQACLTLLHISPNFAILQRFKYPGRYLEDIVNFLSFVHATKLTIPAQAGDAFSDLDEVKIKDAYHGKKTKSHRIHLGYDLVAKSGRPVYAIQPGTVKVARWENASDHKKGWGRYVRIDHGDGFQTIYGHLKSFNVPEGGKVKEGQLIAFSDNTGHSSGDHLHTELWKDGKAVDPSSYKATKYDVRKALKTTIKAIKV